MSSKKETKYQNKLYFPISVSRESPEVILCRILRIAISEAKKSSVKREDYDARRKKGFLEKLTPIMEDPAFAEWAETEFTFKTETYKLVSPFHASAELLSSEPYDVLFEQLLRAGRPFNEASTVLEKFILLFRQNDEVDDLTTKLYCDLSKPEFISDDDVPAALSRASYQQDILCKPNARLFQNDVEALLDLPIPRRELLSLLFSIIAFHFCGYLARMALVACEQEQMLKKYTEGLKGQRIEHHKCYSCNLRFQECGGYRDEHTLNNYLLNPELCKFNQLFIMDSPEEAAEIVQALREFPRRIRLFKSFETAIGYKAEEKLAALSDCFYRLAEGENAKLKKCEADLVWGRSFDHPFEFFKGLINSSNFGMNNAWRGGKDRFKFKLSDTLLKAFVTICCAQAGQKEVFYDRFLEFLMRRGIVFNHDSKEILIDQLEKENLMASLEDSGSARFIVASYVGND